MLQVTVDPFQKCHCLCYLIVRHLNGNNVIFAVCICDKFTALYTLKPVTDSCIIPTPGWF